MDVDDNKLQKQLKSKKHENKDFLFHRNEFNNGLFLL